MCYTFNLLTFKLRPTTTLYASTYRTMCTQIKCLDIFILCIFYRVKLVIKTSQAAILSNEESCATPATQNLFVAFLNIPVETE